MKVLKKPIDITYQGSCPNCHAVIEADYNEYLIIASPYKDIRCPVCERIINNTNTEWERLIVYDDGTAEIEKVGGE